MKQLLIMVIGIVILNTSYSQIKLKPNVKTLYLESYRLIQKPGLFKSARYTLCLKAFGEDSLYVFKNYKPKTLKKNIKFSNVYTCKRDRKGRLTLIPIRNS